MLALTSLHWPRFLYSRLLLVFTVLSASLTITACDWFKSEEKKKLEDQQKISAAPTPPSNFRAQVDGNSIVLNWHSSDDSLQYNLYMASEPGVTPLTVDRLKNADIQRNVKSPFTITGLEEGLTFYFVLTAINAKGEGDPSTEISATPVSKAALKPSVSQIPPPQNLQAVSGDAQVTLSWDPVADAIQYNLYMATEYGINPKLYSQLHNGMAHLNISSPYTIYGLKNYVVHYFVIAAVDATGEGPISAEVFATPSPPERPPAPQRFRVQPGDGQVTLTWEEDQQVARYNLYAATESGVTASTYSRLPGSMTVRNIRSPYVFRGLNNGVKYYFALTAETDEGGESMTSDEITAIPHIPVLPIPSNVQAIAGDKQVSITWQASVGAEQYNVYMAAESGVTPKNVLLLRQGSVFESAVSPLIITDLKNDTEYFFVVTSKNKDRESAISKEISSIPKKPYIPPPPRSKQSISDYQTLDTKGALLADQAQSYAIKPWICVRSVKTGLVWEVKNNDGGLRDKDNTYSWHHPNAKINAGVAGSANGGKCSGSACDIHAYQQAINKLKLCGYDDWRIPTREELLTLLDKKAVYPKATTDIDAFPNTANSYYWTATSYSFNPQMAWFVYFGSGYDYYEYKTFASHVRLVRGVQN